MLFSCKTQAAASYRCPASRIRHATAVMSAAPLPLPSSDWRKVTSHFGDSCFTVSCMMEAKLQWVKEEGSEYLCFCSGPGRPLAASATQMNHLQGLNLGPLSPKAQTDVAGSKRRMMLLHLDWLMETESHAILARAPLDTLLQSRRGKPGPDYLNYRLLNSSRMKGKLSLPHTNRDFPCPQGNLRLEAAPEVCASALPK